jgi:hypothetical protein
MEGYGVSSVAFLLEGVIKSMKLPQEVPHLHDGYITFEVQL